MSTPLQTQVNTDQARHFRQIVTAGWANKSDGHVEAPTGHFALVIIQPDELDELLEAVFEDDLTPAQSGVYPGDYLVLEDNDGNTTVVEYLTTYGAMQAYSMLEREYAIWDATCPKCGNEGPHQRVQKADDNTHICVCGERFDPTEGLDKPAPLAVESIEDETLYLVCNGCGEAFDSILAAYQHGPSDLSGSAGWCGEAGFVILPESEAM